MVIWEANYACNESISSEGWQTFINRLAQTSVERLDLYENEIGDVGLIALADIGTLKSLDLCGNKSITPADWRFFFNTLQRRVIQLKRLYISSNNIDNGCAAALGSLLSNMSTLKTLCMHFRDIYDSEVITAQGWVSLLTSLQDSNLNLTVLDFSFGNIDDEGMQLLARLVSRMSSLKDIRLNDNELVSPIGWQGLSELLQSPNSALRLLGLDNNKLNDDTIVTFSNALAQNTTLKRLSLDECTDDDDNDLITNRGWNAVSTLLCNKTSILDTFVSNHTLHSVRYDQFNEMNLSSDLESHLKLNENKDKVEVARQKILQTHFSTDDDTSKIQELLYMELEMMPTVVEWIGRPLTICWSGTNISGLSAMYNLMRRVPDIFDFSAKKKASVAKRKRGD